MSDSALARMAITADEGCGTHWPHRALVQRGEAKSSGSPLDGRTPYALGYKRGGRWWGTHRSERGQRWPRGRATPSVSTRHAVRSLRR